MITLEDDNPDDWVPSVQIQWRDGVTYKSTDGGKTWRKVEAVMLPCEHCGRTAVEMIYKSPPLTSLPPSENAAA